MAERQAPSEQRSVAYSSMEIGIDENIRTYSGGLGILARDTIRSAADLNVPMTAASTGAAFAGSRRRRQPNAPAGAAGADT
ncbi:MAG: hypothetical protein JXB13_16610 [Phycisphaerae bacterium]|nr:hypothetical protein [Phycisphaerae bacterium]